ncbi:MAG: hypothetical protein IPL19_12800 [Sandaracinaceae bacterium]|nr:hypothetical protein [Sandaracinaceae bacterium]
MNTLSDMNRVQRVPGLRNRNAALASIVCFLLSASLAQTASAQDGTGPVLCVADTLPPFEFEGALVEASPLLSLQNFTVQGWYSRTNNDALPDSYFHILFHLHDLNQGVTHLAVVARDLADGRQGLEIQNERAVIFIETTPFEVDEWNHVAITFDGQTLSVLVNAVNLANVDAGPGTELWLNRDYDEYTDLQFTLGIGRAATASLHSTNGYLTEVVVYDHRRFSGEISDTYRRRTRASAAVGVWPFDEGPSDAAGRFVTRLTGAAEICLVDTTPFPTVVEDTTRPIVACSLAPSTTELHGRYPRVTSHTPDVQYSATDDVDLASVEVTVNGVLVASATADLMGTNDRRFGGSTPLPFSLDFGGDHRISCVATDAAGNVQTSTMAFAVVDSQPVPLTVLIGVDPPHPSLGDTVTFTAYAIDPLGRRIEYIAFNGEGAAEWFECSNLQPADEGFVSCTSPPVTLDSELPGWFSNLAVAETEGGTLGYSRGIRGVYGPASGGRDADNDGLSDLVEATYCTSPTNPDTDNDGLVDGWEFGGLEFSDGRSVPLVDLEAHPCFEDLLVQLIIEEGLEADTPELGRRIDDALDAVREVFQADLGVHVVFERSTIPRLFGRHLSVMQSTSARDVSTGRFALPPERTWTHRPVLITAGGGAGWADPWYGAATLPGYGVGGSCDCPEGEELEACGCTVAPGLADVLVHELGHVILLSHAGRSGASEERIHTPNGRVVYPGFDLGRPNRIPWYHSVMNYLAGGGAASSGVRYSRIRPMTDTRAEVGAAFSQRSIYTTTEQTYLQDGVLVGGLDERPDAPWVQRLLGSRPIWLDSNLHAEISWSCPDGTGRRGWGSHTDNGQDQLLPGTDWNCDGVISQTPVSSPVRPEDAHPYPQLLDDSITDRAWGAPRGAYLIGYEYDLECYPQSREYRESIPDFNGEWMIHGPRNPSTWSVTCPDPLLDQAPPAGSVMLQGTLGELTPDTGVEQLNGLDDDLDGVIDEGFADLDEDGVPDRQDNCPATWNPSQADGGRDGVGDGCQNGTVSATVEHTADGISIVVVPEFADVLGVDIYRDVNGIQTHLGSAYPTTETGSFVDSRTGVNAVRYIVRAVDRAGHPGPAASTEVIDADVRCEPPDQAVIEPSLLVQQRGAAGVAIVSEFRIELPTWFDPVAYGFTVTLLGEDVAASILEVPGREHGHLDDWRSLSNGDLEYRTRGRLGGTRVRVSDEGAGVFFVRAQWEERDPTLTSLVAPGLHVAWLGGQDGQCVSAGWDVCTSNRQGRGHGRSNQVLQCSAADECPVHRPRHGAGRNHRHH